MLLIQIIYFKFYIIRNINIFFIIMPCLNINKRIKFYYFKKSKDKLYEHRITPVQIILLKFLNLS